MKKFITIAAWLRKYFPDGGPHPRTVQRWAKSGEIPARKLGRSWFLHDVAPGDSPEPGDSAAVEAGRRAALHRMLTAG